ncbi:MAG: hypothetical protein ABJC74_07785 [Gemmatimonadota bacterium]
MIEYGVVAYASNASELLPPLAILLKQSRQPARLKVGLFCLFLFLFDMLLIAFRHVGSQGNLWLTYFFHPVEVLLGAWLLSDWQVKPGARRVLGYLVSVYLVAVIGLTVLVELPDTFSLITGSLSGVFMLCLALFTLVTNGLAEPGELRRRDWFWLCLGLAVYFSAETGVEPLQRFLIGTDVQAFIRILMASLIVQMTAMLLITRGMMCPVRPFGQDSVPAR